MSDMKGLADFLRRVCGQLGFLQRHSGNGFIRAVCIRK